MSQSAITTAFENYLASQLAAGEPVILDQFIFANVPGLEPDAPIDRDAETVPQDYIVYQQNVTQPGVVNENEVVYSVTMGTDVGDFDFNWIGLVNQATGLLAMVTHAPVQQKFKNADGQQGNTLTRSFLMEYSGAATATAITTPAETWQIDFTARLMSMDDRQRLENTDIYGAGAFFGDGFLVTGDQAAGYQIAPGVGYVGGLRVSLATAQALDAVTAPAKIWVDACWKGTLTSTWQTVITITAADSLENYTDDMGIAHYVFAVASIDSKGAVTDLRPQGSQDNQALDAYLLRTGGAMTGAIGFKDGDKTDSYALNRQAVWSLMDCYNALPLGNSVWNKVGTVDTTKNQYGRVSFTLVGSMSHDVGMAVQTGFVNIDIIGTEGSNPPGLTLTFFVPDESKGAVIANAVLSASPTQPKHFDLWIKTQSAVAGIMPFGKQSTPGYLTLYSEFETTNVDPEPATPTGVVYMLSANKDGNVIIKGSLNSRGDLSVDGTADFEQAVNMFGGLAVFGTTNLVGTTNQSGDVNISVGHAIYSQSPIILEANSPVDTPVGGFNTTPVVKLRLNGRGALDDPKGAFANIYYEEHVGTDNALCIALNGFGGSPVMRIVNSSTNDASQSSIWFPGSVCPGNYWNFDERYLGVGTAYVQNVRQGAQGSFLIPQGVDIFTPDGSYFMGYHAEGDKAEDDTFFYRALQVKFNGAWSTIGYNTALPNPLTQVTALGRNKITALNNLVMYRPSEEWPETLQNFIDESGYVWSEIAQNLIGNIFIAYDADGVIRYIEQDATTITPLNLSVIGMDSVPDECSIDGSWFFDGENIYQDKSVIEARRARGILAEFKKKLRECTDAVFFIQSCIDTGVATDEQKTALEELKNYSVNLMDAKKANAGSATPVWPPLPEYLQVWDK